MLWGDKQINDFKRLVVKGYAKTVLGFNEYVISEMRSFLYVSFLMTVQGLTSQGRLTCLLNMLLICGDNTSTHSRIKDTVSSVLLLLPHRLARLG
jgi:hypothetical protein